MLESADDCLLGFGGCSGAAQASDGEASASIAVIQTSMERLGQLKEEVLASWNERNVKLEVYVQWKAWERDSHEVSGSWTSWHP